MSDDIDSKVIIELAEKLEVIAQRRAKQISKDVDLIDNKFNSLKIELENELESALLSAEQFKHEGLTVSTIESEGYLRAMKNVKAIVEKIEGWYPST